MFLWKRRTVVRSICHFSFDFFIYDTLLEQSPPPAILVGATEDDFCVQSTVQHDDGMEEPCMFD